MTNHPGCHKTERFPGISHFQCPNQKVFRQINGRVHHSQPCFSPPMFCLLLLPKPESQVITKQHPSPPASQLTHQTTSMQNEGGRGGTSRWYCHDVPTLEVGFNPPFEVGGPGQQLSEIPCRAKTRTAGVSIGGQGTLVCAALQKVGVMEFMTMVALSPPFFPTRINWASGQLDANPLARG